MGPFPRATSNRRFAIVATNYFSEWVESKSLENIRDVDVKKFVWKNIVTSKGLQFDSKAFCKYCSDLGIKNKYSTPTYPQSNEQAQATNKVIVNGLKKRLE